MSRTDVHTPLWVYSKRDPNFDKWAAFRSGLRICSCHMCYGTQDIRYRRAAIRTQERALLTELRKTLRHELVDINWHVEEKQTKSVAYR